MFALIETKGATHIAIYIPGNSAEESLPVLARMLEENAKFIKVAWREIDMVIPEMSIILGDKYTLKDPEGVGQDFTLATPQAFLDNKKALGKKEEENSRPRKELEFKNSELSSLKEKIEALTTEED